MITLAGHGKDDRLVQTDLLQPIIEGDENYTPEWFITPCRNFLGTIDLDPFSNAIANQVIKAELFFTKEDNALAQDWTRFISKFINPPYSAGLVRDAIAKTLEYSHIGETLLLVNTSSSARWFQNCMKSCSAYLHPSKRINFYSPYRTSKGNRYDQTLFYFGNRPLEFAQQFSQIGTVAQPLCLHSPIASEVSEPLVMPPTSQEKSQVLPTLTSAKMHKKSTVRTSLKRRSIPISATIIHREGLTSLQVGSLAPTLARLATSQDLTANILNSGLNICDVSMKDSPDLSSLKTPVQLSIADYEQFLEDSEWLDIVGTIRKSCKVLCSEVPKKGSDCLSLPTLTSNLGTIRPAGQNRSEKWFRDKGFLQSTQVLSAEMMALLFGFPSDWTQCLQDAIAEPVGESNQDISLGEQLISIVQPLSSSESSSLTNNLSDSPRTTLDALQLKANALIQSGASPKGVWIEKSKPSGKDFIQACWRSDKPHAWLGDRKTRYIGKWESDAHVSAKSQFDAGKRLKEIQKQIKLSK